MSYAETAVLMMLGIGVIFRQLTVGGLFAYMQAFWTFVKSINFLTENYPKYSELKGYVQRMTSFGSASKRRPQTPDSQPVRLDGVSYSFGNKSVFEGLNLRIKPEERILITGPNGSGKTTLLNIICGFLEPSGKCRTPNLEETSAMIMPLEFVTGNLRDNVNFHKLDEEKKKLFHDLSRDFDLYEKINADPDELSEGEKRKFAVTRTLVKSGNVLIFDEPIAHLDPQSKIMVMNRIMLHSDHKTLIVTLPTKENSWHGFDRVVYVPSLCGRDSTRTDHSYSDDEYHCLKHAAKLGVRLIQ